MGIYGPRKLSSFAYSGGPTEFTLLGDGSRALLISKRCLVFLSMFKSNNKDRFKSINQFIYNYEDEKQRKRYIQIGLPTSPETGMNTL